MFEHLPVENMVYANQQAYYDAITESSKRADCGPFIDFMLNEIQKTIKANQDTETKHGGINGGINEQKILSLIANSPTITVKEIATALGVSLRKCERLIAEMKHKNLIKRIDSNKSGAWEIINQEETGRG